MKHSIAVAAVGALVVLSSGPAAAFSFTPVNTRFSAKGEVGFAQGQTGFTCTATFRGKVGKRGRAKINSVSLSGADSHCAQANATGLPWKTVATGPTGGTMSHIGFAGGGLACGPGSGGVMVSGSGAWSFDDLLPTNCIFSGSVNTSPAITIVP